MSQGNNMQINNTGHKMNVPLTPSLKRSADKNLQSPSLKARKVEDVTLEFVLQELNAMEMRLQKHTDDTYARLSNDLNEMEKKLLTKIDNDIKLLQDRANDIEDRLASIETDWHLVDQNVKEIDQLKNRVSLLEQKNIKEPIVKDISGDAIVFGIPYENCENLKTIFNKVCLSIDYMVPQIRDIFRVNNRSSTNKNTAVIVKFYSPFDRNRTLKAFSEFRRRTKGPVSLRLAGFDCDSAFRIYESLNYETRRLLQLAVKRKQEKKFWSAFSARGNVYVRLGKDTEPILVNNENSLNDIININ